MNRHAFAGPLASLMAALALSHAVPARADAADTIRVTSERLEGSVTGVPLERALATIAAQSGLVIRVHGSATHAVTAEFRGVALEEGLRSLLRNANFLLVYGAQPDRDGTGRAPLTEVHIYPGGAVDASPPFAASPPSRDSGTGPTSDRALSALTAPESIVRRRAARDLGREGGAGIIEALAVALEREEDAAVRESLAQALGRTRSAEAVPALAHIALHDLDDGVRETAVQALGKVWTESAVEPLIRALGDAGAMVRVAAADALGGAGSDTAADPLRSAAMDDPSAQVRERALIALSRLGAEAAVEPLTMATQDPSPRVRGTARKILDAISAAADPEPR